MRKAARCAGPPARTWAALGPPLSAAGATRCPAARCATCTGACRPSSSGGGASATSRASSPRMSTA
eukprot:10032993-Alexandrium_andersonii.AAC.1